MLNKLLKETIDALDKVLTLIDKDSKDNTPEAKMNLLYDVGKSEALIDLLSSIGLVLNVCYVKSYDLGISYPISVDLIDQENKTITTIEPLVFK